MSKDASPQECDAQKTENRRVKRKSPLLTEEDVRRAQKRWEGVPLDQPVSAEDMRRVVAR